MVTMSVARTQGVEPCLSVLETDVLPVTLRTHINWLVVSTNSLYFLISFHYFRTNDTPYNRRYTICQ